MVHIEKMIIDIEQIKEIKDILGNKSRELVERYLADTQSILSDIDIARATGQDQDIINNVHSLKSSSFQVGAKQIMEQSVLIETFLRENESDLSPLHIQSRLDHMIQVLRSYYAAYQGEIFDHF